MNCELVSVIVPVYNVEQYLEKCILSIVNQTYKNLEIILVDDGSTDKCPDVCDEWAQRDSRIRVLHKANGGLSDARNAGLDVANGEYIAFVDSDDYVAVEMVEALYHEITQTDTDMCIGGLVTVREDGDFLESVCVQADQIFDTRTFWFHFYDTYNFILVIACNKLYKKTLFNTIRFRKEKIHEDEFIIHSIVQNCGNGISFIDKTTYYYRQRIDSITGVKRTLKSYDGIEALFERILFFEEQQEFELTRLCVFQVISIINEIRDDIKRNIRNNRERHVSIKKQYRNIISMVNKRTWSFPARVYTCAFGFCEPISIVLYKIHALLSKWE